MNGAAMGLQIQRRERGIGLGKRLSDHRATLGRAVTPRLAQGASHSRPGWDQSASARKPLTPAIIELTSDAWYSPNSA